MNGTADTPLVYCAWTRIYAHSREAAFIKDASGRYRGATQAYARLFGLPEDFLGRTDAELLKNADIARQLAKGDAEIARGDAPQMAFVVEGIASGEKYPVYGEDGRVEAVRGVCGAKTARESAEVRMATVFTRMDRYLNMEGRAGTHALFAVRLYGLDRVARAFGRESARRADARAQETLAGLFRASDILVRVAEGEYACLMIQAEEENARRKEAELTRAMRFALAAPTQAEELYARAGAAMCYGAHTRARDVYAQACENMAQSEAEAPEAREKPRYLPLSALLENMDGGVIMAEISDDIRVVYASPSFFKMSRRTPTEVGESGEKLLSVVYPPDLKHLRNLLLTARDTTCGFEHAYRVVEPDGKTIGWRHMRAVYLSPDDGSGIRQIIGVVTNINALKASEERLKLAQQRLRVALEQTGALIWEVDIRSRTMYQSEEVSRRLGHSGTAFANAPESMLSLGVIHPDSILGVKHMFERLYAGMDGDDVSIQTQSDTGEWEWMNASYRVLRDEQGLPYRAIGTITMRPNVEFEMREFLEEARFAEIIDETMLGTLSVNLTTNRRTRCTLKMDRDAPENYDELCEWMACQADPRDASALLHAISRDALMQEYRKAQTWVITEFRRSAPGGARWTSLMVNLIRHPISDNVHAFFYLRDIEAARRWEALAEGGIEKNSATLLYTPRTFAQLVKVAVSQTQPGAMCCMIVFDIGDPDVFRQLNGVQATQKALIGVGRVCLGGIEGETIAGHLDDTHFAVFRPDAQDVQTERLRLNRKRALIDKVIEQVYIGENLRISIGFSVSPAAYARFEDMAEKALVACRVANRFPGQAILEYNDVEMSPLRNPAPGPRSRADNLRLRVLLADESEQTRQTLRAALDAEFDVRETASPAEAAQLAGSGQYQMVALGVNTDAGWQALTRIREDKALGELPVMGIVKDGGAESEARALNLGASDVVAPPFSALTLVSRARNITARYIALRIAETNRVYEQRFQSQANQLLLAQYDELTGLYNRQGFHMRVRERLNEDAGGQYAILLWDIDNFKTINDAMGVKEGDRLLKDFAYEIQTQRKESEIAARVDADHFVMLTRMDEARIFEICEGMSAWLAAYPFDIRLTGRAGVYAIDDRQLEVSVMCDRALLAIRAGKDGFSRRISYYDKSLRDQLMEEQQLVSEMLGALETGQFAVYFQPQYDYVSRRIIGAEALVRWIHPQKGMIPPAKFIELFEKNGYISLLDAYVWEQSCQYLKKWLDESGIEPIALSVNLSRIDIYNTKLCESLSALLTKYGLSPHVLKLEITESAYIDNPQYLIEVVSSLQSMGFTIEMDDFGSGYSSLNTLKDVPVDVLKLDTKFLSRGRDDSRGGNILSSVIRMARWLNLPIIAEGVETKEQAEYLKSLGCCYMQGYYFARPMPADEFETMLRKGARGTHAPQAPMRMDDMNAFWNPSAQTMRFFSSFIGGAAIMEYRLGNAEVILANDHYFAEIGETRDDCQNALKSLQLCYDERNRAAFLGMLDRASHGGQDEECDLMRVPTNGKAPVWTHNRARLLAVNGQSHVLFVTVENVSRRVAQESRRATQIFEEMLKKMYANVLEIDLEQMRADVISGEASLASPQLWAAAGDWCALFANESDLPAILAWLKTPGKEDISHMPHARGTFTRVRAHDQLYILCAGGAPAREASGAAYAQGELSRAIAKQAGYTVVRYIPGARRARVEFAPGAFSGEWQTDVPRAWIQSGRVCEESVATIEALFSQIDAGESAGEAPVRMRMREEKNGQWRRARFTALKDAAGRTQSAILTFADELSEKTAEKRAAIFPAEGENSGIFIEADLTANRVKNLGGELLEYAPSLTQSYDDAVRALAQALFPGENRDRALEFFAKERLCGLLEGGVAGAEAQFDCPTPRGPRGVYANSRLYTDAETAHACAFILLREFAAGDEDAQNYALRAQRDGMTGLYNRAAGERRMREALQKNTGVSCALLVMDLDNLKAINDALGHAYGDKAISIAAAQLKNHFRKTDIVGRMGGDEFAALLIGAEAGDSLRGILRMLLARIERMRVGDEGQIPVRCSIGVAFGKTGEDDFDTLYEQADTALYTVKRAGKGTYAFYTPDMRRMGQNDARDWAGEEADALGLTGVKKLMRAMSGFFPNAYSVNVSKNTYVGLGDHKKAGVFDEIVETLTRCAQPDERARLIKSISRQNLMNAYACGVNGTRIDVRTQKDDGTIAVVQIDIALASDGAGGDICGIFSITSLAP